MKCCLDRQSDEERSRNSPWQVTWSLSYFSFDLVFNYIRLHIFLCLGRLTKDISRLLLIFWHKDSSVNLAGFQISSASITCFDFNQLHFMDKRQEPLRQAPGVGRSRRFRRECRRSEYIYLACISAALLIDTLFSSPDSCPPRTHRLFVVPPRYRCLNSSELFFRFLLRAVCVLSCRAESLLINAFISGPN